MIKENQADANGPFQFGTATRLPAMEKTLNYGLLSALLILASPLFFFGGPAYYSPRLFNEFWNLGHLFFFALFVFLLDSYLVSRQGNYSVKITLTTDRYSGVSLRHFPGDWSGWAGLGLFVMQQTDRRVLYLDNVRLF